MSSMSFESLSQITNLKRNQSKEKGEESACRYFFKETESPEKAMSPSSLPFTESQGDKRETNSISFLKPSKIFSWDHSERWECP